MMLLLAAAGPPALKVGLIGLDTSHVVEFTALLNDVAAAHHVPGARVVAGVRAGSPDVEQSATRIDRFTAELRDKWKIEIVPSIEQLLPRVDAVMITSVDGRTHLEQARRVFPAHKPTFIDKPMAASAGDAREILGLARKAHTPLFSASSLRFVPEIQSLAADPRLAPMVGAFAWGPAPTEPHHPDLFWYGVHVVEILYILMGPGCVAVARVKTPGADVVVGRWGDGRLGTVRGLRDGAKSYGAVGFGADAVVAREVKEHDYRGLLVEVVKFFQTGKPPVPPETTVEMMAFMEAAELSKSRAGAEVALPPR
jgi:predicted dehydrogenase